ncbi:hypothetical protein ABPG75_005417 [Micractinium tetrahymenae]
MAALVAAGGASGYAQTGSVPSMVAGLGIGMLFSAGGWQINSGRPDVGHPLSLAASLALLGAMAPRFAKTRKVWPAGVMSLAGALSAVYQGMKTREWLG